MQTQLKLVSLAVLIASLFVFTTPTKAAIPTIQWDVPSDEAEWYNIIINQHRIDVLNEWIQDGDGLCNAATCTFDPNTYLPFGLDAGDFNIIIEYWDPSAERVRRIDRRTLNITTPDTSIATPGGRIEITIPDNDLFDWVQVWMGDRSSYTPIVDIYQNGWYGKDLDMECSNGSCTFLTDAHGANGRYVAYLRYWDSQEGLGNWGGGFEFSINEDRASAVRGHNLVLDANNRPTLTWNDSGSLTWYRVWLGGSSTAVDSWMKATDIGCGDGGTCTFQPDVQLAGGEVYQWYVYGWGPGGFPRGGLGGSGWSEGEPVYIEGSDNAFQMQNGLVVFEAESTRLVGDWRQRTSFGSYTGSGYIVWREGDTDTATDRSRADVMTYIVEFPEAGSYRLQMRATSPDPGDLYNDIFLRVLGDGIFAEAIDPSPEGNSDYVNMGQDWFKVYNNSTERWSWQASHVDNDAHQIFVVVPEPGEYVFQISGRSNQFRIDRFVLFDEDRVSENQATDVNNPESPRG